MLDRRALKLGRWGTLPILGGLAFAALTACPSFGSDNPDSDASMGAEGGAGDAGEVCPVEDDAGGATELVCDGSTASVLLSSRKHCGSCSHDCLDEDCLQGRCQPTTFQPMEPPDYPWAQLTARDSQFVYWVHADTVRRAPARQPNAAPTVLAKRTDLDAGSDTFLQEVLVDESFGYVHGPDAIFRFPLNGGDGTLTKLRFDGYPNVHAIAITGQLIYSTNTQQAMIMRMAKDGTSPMQLVAGHRPLGPLVADSAFLFWLDGEAPDSGTGAALARTDPLGSEVMLLARGLQNPTSLAMDATYVYWADSATHQISRMPKLGGASTRLTTTPDGLVTSLVVDEQHVYWLAIQQSSANTKTLWKASKCGGPATAVATNITGETLGFVVDDSYVYLAQYEHPFLRVVK